MPLHCVHHESSMKEWVSATCELLSSNSWPENRPLCLNMSTGWPEEYREQGFIDILVALSKNTTTRTLKLKNVALTSKQLGAFETMLKANGSLTCISMENVRDSGRVCLSLPNTFFMEASDLTEVCIRRCRIDADMCHALRHATTTSPLMSLELADVIFEGGIAPLSEALRDDSYKLERLAIRNARLSSSDLSCLLDSVSRNKSLRCLSLENLNLGEGDASKLSSILRTNQTLTTLRLPGNNLGGDSVSCLVEGLEHNASLQTLCLAYNPVADDGAKALVKTLTNNPNQTLKELDVEYCEIWHEGCACLAVGLGHMSGLARLGLAGNDLEQCAIPLVQSVTQNKTVQHISGFQALACREDNTGKWHKVERFLRLNRNNRRRLLASPQSLCLWPHVLEHADNDADVVFHLIRDMPSIALGRGSGKIIDS